MDVSLVDDRVSKFELRHAANDPRIDEITAAAKAAARQITKRVGPKYGKHGMWNLGSFTGRINQHGRFFFQERWGVDDAIAIGTDWLAGMDPETCARKHAMLGPSDNFYVLRDPQTYMYPTGRKLNWWWSGKDGTQAWRESSVGRSMGFFLDSNHICPRGVRRDKNRPFEQIMEAMVDALGNCDVDGRYQLWERADRSITLSRGCETFPPSIKLEAPSKD